MEISNGPNGLSHRLPLPSQVFSIVSTLGSLFWTLVLLLMLFLLLQRALEKLEKGPTERSCHKLFSMPFFGQSTGYSFESRAKNFWSNTTEVLRPSCRFMFPHCWQVQNRWKQGIGFTSSRAKDPRHSFLSSARFFMLESLLKLIGECIWTVYLCIWTLKLICSASPFLHKFKKRLDLR